MARTPRTFSRRSHAEAKAGENIGKGKRRDDVTEKTKQTNQQKETSEVSLTRSPSRFLGRIRMLPRLRHTRFHGGGLRDGRTWREGVLSSISDDATKPKNIIPLSNPHTRTTGFQGTRMCMADLPGTKSGSRFRYYTAPPPQIFRRHLARVSFDQELEARRTATPGKTSCTASSGCALPFGAQQRGLLGY